MIRYIQAIEDAFKDELDEGRSIEKPKPKAGYVIKRAMVRDPKNPKRVVKGWVQTPKHKKVGKIGGKSKSQRKKAARKAARTRKHDIAGQKRAKKKARITRKKSKQAGLTK